MIFFSKPEFWVFAYRAFQAAFGVLTLSISFYVLSPTDLGLFQTMLSLASLYMVFDMGLSITLVQLSASRFTACKWYGSVIRKSANRVNFLSLCKSAYIWYAFAALFFLSSAPITLLFLGSSLGGYSSVWVGPCVLLAIATAAQLVFLPLLALIEGTGRIAEVYKIRILQLTIGSVITWIVLLAGGRLWAVAVLPTSAACVSLAWTLLTKRRFIAQAYRSRAMSLAVWYCDVWPLQWRAATGWLAGYAQVLVHVPILFASQGPTAAGRMGITMTVANTLSVLALAYPVANVPRMVRFASQKDWRSLDLLFHRAWKASFGLYLLGAFAIMLLILLIQQQPEGARLLPIGEALLLLAAMAAYHLAGLYSLFIRAHLRDPLVNISIVCAVLTVSCSCWAATRWGSMGSICVILIVNVCLYFPLTLTAMRRLHNSRAAPS